MSDFFQGFDDDDGGRRSLARSLNFRFTDEIDRQYRADRPDGMPPLPLLRTGGDSPIGDLMYGTFGGVEAQVFEFRALTYPEDPGFERRTCVLFTFPADFPALAIGPHNRLSRANERSSDELRQRYRITCRDQEALALVLDDNLRSWLLANDARLRIELAGGGLLGHLPSVEPDEIPVVLQQVYGVFLRIPDAAWARYGFGYSP